MLHFLHASQEVSQNFLAPCKDSILKKVSLHPAPSADSSGRMRLHSDSGLDICLLVSFHFGAKLTSIMPCEAAAATATEQPEGQVFLHHSVTGNSKVIRSQSVNCKLVPTGSDWPAAELVSSPKTHCSPPAPGDTLSWLADVDIHTMKQLTNTWASVCSQDTWYQVTSLISLSHLPPETKITLCRAWLWGNFSLFDSYRAF